MGEALSLMEFLQELVSDDGMRDDFLADPHGTLAGHGLAQLSPADVHDALLLVEDTRTLDYGQGATGPAAPPPDGHADAVGYLSSYLSGPADDGADLAFGAGDPDADLPDDATEDGAADPFDLSPAAPGDGFGSGASDRLDQHDLSGPDSWDDAWDDATDLPAGPAHGHDADF